jgi:hypothetical protein
MIVKPETTSEEIRKELETLKKTLENMWQHKKDAAGKDTAEWEVVFYKNVIRKKGNPLPDPLACHATYRKRQEKRLPKQIAKLEVALAEKMKAEESAAQEKAAEETANTTQESPA